MLFSVIYEFDCPMDVSVRRYTPSQRRLFQMTECSDGKPSDWCGDIFQGRCRHRKLCAVLTREQFERFLNDTGLIAENVGTGGSIGAPGLGYGLSPAISFRNDDPDAIMSAYVTPLPLVYTLKDFERFPMRPKHPVRRLRKVKRRFAEDDFERVKKAILAVYG